MRQVRFIPAAIWTAVILGLLISPDDGLPRFPWLDFPHADKLIHATLFAIGSVLWVTGFGKRTIMEQPQKVSMSVILWILSMGSLTEYLQHCCVPSRSGDLIDLLADVAGGLIPLGYVLWRTQLHATSQPK